MSHKAKELVIATVIETIKDRYRLVVRRKTASSVLAKSQK